MIEQYYCIENKIRSLFLNMCYKKAQFYLFCACLDQARKCLWPENWPITKFLIKGMSYDVCKI